MAVKEYVKNRGRKDRGDTSELVEGDSFSYPRRSLTVIFEFLKGRSSFRLTDLKLETFFYATRQQQGRLPANKRHHFAP